MQPYNIIVIITLSFLLIAIENAAAMTSLIKEARDPESLAHKALNLWSTPSSSQYRFPEWVADEWEARILPTFGSTATVYHASDNLPEVRTMAIFREPTNIAMDRKGSRRTLDEFYQTQLFGESGRYRELFPEGFSTNAERNDTISAYYRNQEGEVCADDEQVCVSSSSYRKNLEGAYRFTNKDYRMPQIAAYAKTPMRYILGNNTSYSNEKGVHVLSLVGAGFDAHQQPDYQYYYDRKTQDIRSDRIKEFYHERKVSFMIALQCAADHNLDRIEFVPIGAGVFSVLLPKGRVIGKLTKALKSKEVQQFKKSLEQQTGKEIHVSFGSEPPFTHNNGLGSGIPSFYEESGWTGEGHGKSWEDAINRTLFINAWDPWSLVGNGNDMDYSVDGMYGRQSALALLCWPITNPHIQYKKIDI